ncbi:hypothetical protein SAMN05216516_107116 [Izhakiella capsodis]|uniref:DNA utilization protein HofO C-terminal domain-containing protein n=1 Tax=Izhakiella capsodis TaxID=1367852 RepID=A0A1I4YZR2_9GAMM|nr:hypothetical protein [Izhakiella capsodis]SFN43478.1 hypothetical protein SAMN05216516_107116 [Izhakiella capsodis]
MIESTLWWLLTSPLWRRHCILLFLALSFSLGCWLFAGQAAGHKSVQLEEQQRQWRKSVALCVHQLANLPRTASLRLREKQQYQRAHFLARRDFSLSAFLHDSQAHLLQWQTSPSTRSLQLVVAWLQVSPVMDSLLHQLPGTVISELSLRPHEKMLHMNLVLEITDEPVLAAATDVL